MERLISVDDIKGMDKRELLELVNLTDDFSSNTDTKFHFYEPAIMAREYHQSLANLRAMFGGNRSSKTFSHIIEYGIQFTGQVPPSLEGRIPPHRIDPSRRNRMCMGDYPNSFIKVIWPYVQQLIPREYISDVIKDSGKVKAIANKYGGFLEFMNYEQDVSKFQGTSRHSIGYDEEPPKDIRDENLLRLVDTNGEETHSLTPVSGALKYLYDDIYLQRGRETEREYELVLDNGGKLVDAIPGNLRDVILPDGDSDIHVFFACIFDNPSIPKEAAIRILSKFPKSEMIVRSKGHFMFLSGLVYKEFTEHTHVIDPFDDWYRQATKRDYRLYVAIDPHPRTPHAVLLMVVRRDGQRFVVDEIWDDCDGSSLVEQVLIKCRGVRPEVIIIDPLANTPDPSTKSCLVYDLMDFGLDDPAPISGSKDKAHGITLTQETLAVNERGVPGIFVTRNCTVFRSEITRYAWDDYAKHTRTTKGLKQNPIEKNDHMMENLRRLIIFTAFNDVDVRARIPREHEKEPDTALTNMGASPVTGY